MFQCLCSESRYRASRDDVTRSSDVERCRSLVRAPRAGGRCRLAGRVDCPGASSPLARVCCASATTTTASCTVSMTQRCCRSGGNRILSSCHIQGHCIDDKHSLDVKLYNTQQALQARTFKLCSSNGDCVHCRAVTAFAPICKRTAAC